jgi:hypothetical protein
MFASLFDTKTASDPAQPKSKKRKLKDKSAGKAPAKPAAPAAKQKKIKANPKQAKERVAGLDEKQWASKLAKHVEKRNPSSNGKSVPTNRSDLVKQVTDGGKSQKYNFDGVDFLDHFETPITAYQDIQPALAEVAKALGIEQRQLRVYDPYFCQGSIKRHLGELGFSSVYNENEDFYETDRYKQPRGPPAGEYDVVVTNPPYSGDHKVS